MNSKQLILDFLNVLEEKSLLLDKDKTIRVNIQDNSYSLFGNVNYIELKNIVELLKNEKAIEVIKEPYYFFFKGHLCVYENISGDPLESQSYYIKLGSNFEQYKERLINEITEEIDNAISYEIIFDEDYETVYLHDIFKQIKHKIVKYHPDSDNSKIMNHLYNNPNNMIEKKELVNVIGYKIKKSTSTIVRDLGFTGILATIFFKISKTGIKFKNPVKNKITSGLQKEIQNLFE